MKNKILENVVIESSMEIEGIGELTVSGFVYSFKFTNQAIKKKAQEIFPDARNIYHVTFYLEGWGDGYLFFVNDLNAAQIYSVHPSLRKKARNDERIIKSLIDLVKININHCRVL